MTFVYVLTVYKKIIGWEVLGVYSTQAKAQAVGARYGPDISITVYRVE